MISLRSITCSTLVALLLVMAALGTDAAAAVIYVKRDATGSNNGTSWTNARTNLMAAIPAASEGDELWVAHGTYRPNDGNPSNLSRSQAFVLKNSVSVLGGFAGTETARAQRDPATHITILSGDLAGNDADLDGDGFPDETLMADNCYHVFFHPANLGTVLNGTAVLDGCMIRSGYASQGQSANPPADFDLGGGMFNSSHSPTLTRCVFQGNRAGTSGAALYNRSSAPTVTGCTFQENAADTSGGGMYNGTSSAPAVSDCTFRGNEASSNGGGMFNSGSSPSVTGCTFDSNQAGSSGGALYCISASVAVTNCTFYGNQAGSSGGAVFSSATGLTLRYCTCSGNTAGSGGGGIYHLSGLLLLSSSIVWGNGGGEIAGSGSTQVTDSVVQDGYPGAGNRSGNPRLIPLGYYGGVTATMPVSAGSSALAAGASPGMPATDQRGFVRGTTPTSGACEFQSRLAYVVVTDTSGIRFALPGGAVELVAHSEGESPNCQWFRGLSGDERSPVAGAIGNTLRVGSWTADDVYWAKVTAGAPDQESSTNSLSFEAPASLDYAQWTAYFGLAGPDSAPDADLAGDGVCNVVKYSLGVPPRTRWSWPSVQVLDLDGSGNLDVTVPIPKWVPSVAILVDGSSDLVGWSSAETTLKLTAETRHTWLWQALYRPGTRFGFLRLRIATTP